MSVLIVGSEGSMGQRYQAILRYLKKEFLTFDLKKFHCRLEDFVDQADAIIVATPTDSHFEFLSTMAHLDIPILCEKPLTKDINQLDAIKDIVRDENLNLTMMMQYRILDDPNSYGETSYDYFRTGNDGLVWDCIQLIGLARTRVYIANDSPVWKCTLNGKTLSLSEMDLAYVRFIQQWFEKPGDDIDWLIDVHRKAMEFNQ